METGFVYHSYGAYYLNNKKAKQMQLFWLLLTKGLLSIELWFLFDILDEMKDQVNQDEEQMQNSFDISVQ